MTDEQIVKASECCKDNDGCNKCPYGDIFSEKCINLIQKNALDLIKRQQAEIERLQKESADKERAYTDEFCCRKEWQRKCRDLLEEKIEVKCKAVREFAERLKETNLYEFIEEYFDNAELCYEVRSDLFNDFVDNLVREMTEKEGGK